MDDSIVASIALGSSDVFGGVNNDQLIRKLAALEFIAVLYFDVHSLNRKNYHGRLLCLLTPSTRVAWRIVERLTVMRKQVIVYNIQFVDADILWHVVGLLLFIIVPDISWSPSKPLSVCPVSTPTADQSLDPAW